MAAESERRRDDLAALRIDRSAPAVHERPRWWGPAWIGAASALFLLLCFMEATALRMVHRDGQGIALTETIDEHVVAEEVERFLPIPGASVLGVLLNSVLVSAGNRQGSTLRIGFLYRVLQEYFVAAALARQGLSADGFPGEVPALHGEITSFRRGPSV